MDIDLGVSVCVGGGGGGVWGGVCVQRSVSLCLCKRSGLLRDGAS